MIWINLFYPVAGVVPAGVCPVAAALVCRRHAGQAAVVACFHCVGQDVVVACCRRAAQAAVVACFRCAVRAVVAACFHCAGQGAVVYCAVRCGCRVHLYLFCAGWYAQGCAGSPGLPHQQTHAPVLLLCWLRFQPAAVRLPFRRGCSCVVFLLHAEW